MTMEYWRLGRTGLEVSVLGIGSWQLAGSLSLDGPATAFPIPAGQPRSA